MPLRLIEVTVPTQDKDLVDRVMKEHECQPLWISGDEGQRALGRVTLPAEETEKIMDELSKRFRSSTDFRIDLIALEASIPRAEEPAQPEPVEVAASKSRSRVSREELYHDLLDATDLNRVYVWMVILSSLVAVVGLYAQSLVAIIGAMVIAPLLGPNVALCLAATLGDLKLAKKAISTNMIGLILALGLSIVLGMIFDIQPDNHEVLIRTRVNISDVIIAFASGAAGVLAFTSGASSTLIGVMVAVALMPPLVTMGILIGNGQYALANGAAVLLMMNIICINLSGVVTFIAQGIHPLNWWEQGKARQTTRIAIGIWMVLFVIFLMIMRVYLWDA